MKNGIEMKPGQTFPLTIKRIGINGEGVGYFKRKAVFVPGALPGEEITAEAVKVMPKFTEAVIKKLRKPSPSRVTPPCPIYEQCGGCQLQHLDYSAQLTEKKGLIIQALERYTSFNIDKLPIHDTIGMDDPWRYRNKAQFQTGIQKGKMAAGLYSPNSNELVNIEECIVQHRVIDETIRLSKKIMNKLSIPVFSSKNKQGVKTIVVRYGFETGDVQAVIVTGDKTFPKASQFAEQLMAQKPRVKSVVHNVNPGNTHLVMGDVSKTIAGSDTISEKLGEFEYELSARAFFQLNPVQTKKLYDEVKKAANVKPTDKVADTYCGSGTIGLWIGKNAAEVRGMDTIAVSIKDARANAEKYGVNATYEVGPAEKWLPIWKEKGWVPDVLVTDPPRTGLDRKLIQTIKQIKPATFVYVSCNPSTLAKDLTDLASVYKIDSIQPVDMFPQTAQVECVVALKRK
ncbi:23S rRNA (uracil(1939)-C(5))-methyltransferase RlmD [Domibacillus sp. A3M-37]|uniref:23S rRNA (uracil(1939)-C(5))-methyltransferase RlmD n=1 Tax=Domibacillus sp. A3M-37 TaxID=2962037 RepID=UPI0020B735A6|nr:23S rRNA (uracil(1939)-C(5))-methyltransferase RlmD [Domibacillus sp. A3M-37]MCP3762125.1 23S rRNA (uracil(1939)-C(5))-methyltransferase RlmD [Domibacillus sp. A3M-37]